jgi:transposase
MDRQLERCCGLDVHKETIAACVRIGDRRGRATQHVQTFRTTAADLVVLRDWLAAHGVTHVAMESTGVYWKPVFYALESDFTCLLVNAAHIKQVPGRKTDVLDCVWIAQLLEHGLLRGSFVPPVPIREVRDLTRYRKALIQDRTRVANRLHKALEDAGVKLASVASDILGVSGRAMLQALAQGTHRSRDPGRPGPGPAARQAAGAARGAGRPLSVAPRVPRGPALGALGLH